MVDGGRLEISVIGPPRVASSGAPLRFDTRKAVALLAVLAARGEPQSREAVATLLWPDYDTTHAAGALRRTLSVTRAAVGPDALRVEGRALSLGEVAHSDVARLRDTCAAVQRHHADGAAPCDRCLAPLVRIPELARGRFLEGFGLRDSPEFDDWMAATAEEIDRLLSDALDHLADGLAARGRLAQAVTVARRRLAIDPLHEGTYRRLIALEAERGERSAAVQAYRECVRILDRELGVTPMPETTEVYRRATAGTPPVPETEPAARPIVRGGPLPLVGRDPEITALEAAWRGAAGGAARVVLMEGEPGIGKTRLLEELRGRAVSAGAGVVNLVARESERAIPYAPILEGLTRAAEDDAVAGRINGLPAWARGEIGRLVPDLPGSDGAGAPPPIEGPGAEIRFVDAVSRALLAAAGGAKAGLVLVDDAHWADDATVAVLSYTARRLAGTGLCLVMARRSTEPDDDRLAEVIRGARRSGILVEVRPARLTAAEVARLARGAPGKVDAARLYDETEGIPFFVAEYLATPAPPLRGIGETPLTIRELLAARMAQLGEAARQVMVAAAVIGRSFDVDLVREASGRSAVESAAALDELLAHGLIREAAGADGAPAYDFDHAKTRDVAYASASLARRRLLHGRAASALIRRAGSRPGATSGIEATAIGHHLREAGDDRGAAVYLLRAADAAASVHANAEALELYRAVLALDPRQAVELHERIGELAVRVGRYDEAIAAFEAAAAAEAATWRPEHRLASVHVRRREWAVAEAHLQAAEETLASADGPMTAERARLTADRALVAHRLGQPRRAATLAGEALALAEEADDPACRAQAHNLLGILARAAGHHKRARTHLERSLELAEGAGFEDARIASLNNLALLARGQGDATHALDLARAALDAAERIGDLHREAALRNNLADALHAAGQRDEALAEIARSVALFAQIGERGGMEPEIWKLVDW